MDPSCRRRDMLRVVVWIALSLLVSTATAFPTSHMSNILASNHARALTQVTCPTGSALNATLGACAIVCAHGYIRDDLKNTTLGVSTVFGVCEPCSPGKYREGGEANACLPCDVGSSNSRSGQATCVPCSYQGGTRYVNTTGAVRCAECPAGTTQRVGETDTNGIEQPSGLALEQCVCEKGLYDPVVNGTGSPCVSCPAGAVCAGDITRPTAKPLYYGVYDHPEYFLRCHRMISNESPCLGSNKCLPGFEGQSCSRCSKGYYRFQRNCVECKGKDPESNLIVAYFFLLIAFYVVKKLSTIVLPSMYIILTYVQCLSIVGNRQGWGTVRTKTFLKITEIVNFPLDFFIPSCAAEMPFVHKAIFFTVTPIFYVLVDVVLVDIVLRKTWPIVADALAYCVVKMIKVKYVFGVARNDAAMSEANKTGGAVGQLRHELGMQGARSKKRWYLRSPVEAEEALDSKFGKNAKKKVRDAFPKSRRLFDHTRP